MFKLICRWGLKLAGWKIRGPVPRYPKYLIIGAPHTSNWDFVLAIAAKYSLGLKAKFLGKAELFRFPYGWFFRMLGGYPVDRSQSTNMVEQIVEIFRQKEEFAIGLAPEGTRKAVQKWKTGFYHIAAQAGIPIIMIGLDYANKELRIADEPFWPSGDIEKELPQIQAFFAPFRGKRPQGQKA